LYATNCSIVQDAADDIAAVILNNKSLQKLDLDENYFAAIGIKKIAVALQNVSTLIQLHIGGNTITAEAADDLAMALRNNNKLQILGFGKNVLTMHGIIIVVKELQNFCTLTELLINDNQIDESAADDIGAMICNNKCLQKLDISHNCLKTTGIIKIAQALQTLSSLIELYINNNDIRGGAADDIVAVIVSNNRLQKLDFSRNCIGAAGTIKIAKLLQNNYCTLVVTNLLRMH